MEGFSRLAESPETDAAVRAQLVNVMDAFLDAYASNASSSSSAAAASRSRTTSLASVPCATPFPYGAANESVRSCAWGVLQNESYQWDPQLFGTVGDHFGLFPIANLNRFLRAPEINFDTGLAGRGSGGGGQEADLIVAARVAVDYNMNYPNRIPDGTFSRTGGFDTGNSSTTTSNSSNNDNIENQGWPLSSFVWADDQFMGMTLLCRLAKLNRSLIPASLRDDYLSAARQRVRE
jgi:hypothetical protein